MFSVIKIAICLVSCIGFIQVQAQEIEEKFFEQKLDHENDTAGTWQQRYLQNSEFFKPGGPIFVYIGGPEFAPILPLALQKGSMVEYAKEQGASIVALESRYYGKSHPTTDLSNENLAKFHTIQQRVEDTVVFVKGLKAQPEFKDAKTVGFGILTTGTRLVIIARDFPGTFDIVVASSSPVEAKFEVPEYFEKAVEVLNKTDPQCFETIQEGLLCLQKITEGETCEERSLKDLKKGLNLCEDLDHKNPQDVAGLFQAILKNIGAVILTNNPDPAFPYNVKKMCEGIENKTETLHYVDNIAHEINKITALRNQTCMEFRFEKHFEKLHNDSWDSPAVIRGERQSFYSRCNGLPFIRTTEGLNLPYGDKLATQYTTELCNRLFGVTAEELKTKTEAANAKYGGRKVQPKCGIFVSGSDELLQSLEITTAEQAGQCNRAIVIEGAAFAKDKGEIPAEEMSYPPALRAAQIEIGNLIGEWLKTGDCCKPREPRKDKESSESLEILSPL